MADRHVFDRLVHCPTCKAQVGERCVSAQGNEQYYVHKARIERYDRTTVVSTRHLRVVS